MIVILNSTHWNFFFIFCYNSSSWRSQWSKCCDINNKHKDNNLHLNSVNNDTNPVHSIKNRITRREAYLNVRTVYTNRFANNRKVDGNYQIKEKTNIEKEINREMSPVRYKNVCISYELKLISSCSYFFFSPPLLMRWQKPWLRWMIAGFTQRTREDDLLDVVNFRLVLHTTHNFRFDWFFFLSNCAGT